MYPVTCNLRKLRLRQVVWGGGRVTKAVKKHTNKKNNVIDHLISIYEA